MKEAFCVECGAEGVPLKDGVCRECRLGGRPLLVAVQPEVRVEVCQRCGAEHRGDSWRTREDATEAYDRAAMDAVRIHEEVDDPTFQLAFEQTAPRTLEYEVRMEGWLDEEPVEAAVDVRVVIHPGICRTCSREAGGYFEAVLQLRPPKDRKDHPDLEEAFEEVLDHLASIRQGGNRQAFVTKTQEVHGGYDIYVGDTRAGHQAAKRISERYGARVGHSTEQVGMEDGQPVMRTSISVRMPPYGIGDLVERADELWQVRGFTKRLVYLVRLPDGQEDHVDAYDGELSRVAPASEVRETTVVSKSAGEAQVLDPDTMETVTVATPGQVPGETLEIVKWRGRVVAVPPRETMG